MAQRSFYNAPIGGGSRHEHGSVGRGDPFGSAAAMGSRSLIKDLEGGASFAVTITGIVTNRGDLRHFNGKDGREASVLGFVVRDESGSSCTVSCWDETAISTDTSGIVEIGQFVSVENAQPKRGGGYSGRNLTEVSLSKRSGSTVIPSTPFSITLPTMPACATIATLPQMIPNPSVNLMAVIADVGETKDLTTKAGKKTKVRRSTIVDAAGSIEITFWGRDCDNVDKFIAGESIVFFERLKLDTYRDAAQLTFSFESGMQINPDSSDAQQLYQWARANPEQAKQRVSLQQSAKSAGSVTGSVIDDATRQNLLIEATQNSCTLADMAKRDVSQAYFVCNCVVSLLKLDLTSKENLMWECSCGNGNAETPCGNPICKGWSLKLRVGIIDNTSTLNGVTISNTQAEALIGMTATALAQQPHTTRVKIESDLQWQRFRMVARLQSYQMGGKTNVSLDVLDIAPVA